LVKLLVLVGPCYAVHEVPNGSPWTGTPVALPGWEGDTWTNSFKFGAWAGELAAGLKPEGIEFHVGHPWRAPASGWGGVSLGRPGLRPLPSPRTFPLPPGPIREDPERDLSEAQAPRWAGSGGAARWPKRGSKRRAKRPAIA